MPPKNNETQFWYGYKDENECVKLISPIGEIKELTLEDAETLDAELLKGGIEIKIEYDIPDSTKRKLHEIRELENQLQRKIEDLFSEEENEVV